MATAGAPSVRKPREQPLPIRISHWCNALFIILMAGSGLQILRAYPNMGPRGELYAWYPFQNMSPPEWLCIGGWLGGGRHWHFAIAWFFVINGLIYLTYFFTSGEWRRRMFLPWRDVGGAIAQFLYYVHLRRTPPDAGFYNGLQRLAYTSVIIFGLVMVLSGLAIYKPVQLHFLTSLFGGYDIARFVHLSGLTLIVMFLMAHLVLVISHPHEIVKMITGGVRG